MNRPITSKATPLSINKYSTPLRRATGKQEENQPDSFVKSRELDHSKPMFEAAAGDKKRGSLKQGLALGLLAAGAVAGIVGSAGTAHAADVQGCYSYSGVTAQGQQTTARSTDPVTFGTSQDAVRSFSLDRQLYVRGNPLNSSEMRALENLLKEHPNTYVVIADYADNYQRWNDDLSCGIGNSQLFKSLKDSTTGEANGRLFQIFMGSNSGANGGRKAFLVAHDAYDNAGVGEDQFNPGRPLFDAFVSAHRSGKSMPGMIEAVMRRMDSAVNQRNSRMIGDAQSAVSRAQSLISQAEQAQRNFERTFGGNVLAPPSLAGWRTQVGGAEMALNNQAFGDARSMASSVISEAQNYINSVNQYQERHAGATTSISTAQSRIEEAREAKRTFEREFDDANIPAPDFGAWSQTVAGAERALDQGRHSEATSAAGGVSQQARAYIQQLEEFRANHGRTVRQIEQAENNLESAQTAHRGFRSEYGSGGALGSPDFGAWGKELEQAREAADGGDFGSAQQKARGVESKVQSLIQGMQDYGQAARTGEQLKAQLDELGPQVDELGGSPQSDQARALYQEALQQYELFKSRHDDKAHSFAEPLQEAGRLTRSAQAKTQAAQQHEKQMLVIKISAGAAVGVGLLALALITNHKSRKQRGKAEKALENATTDIAQRSRELLQLMEEADYHDIANYSGKTKKKAEELIDNVTDALTLVGGAEKFLEQAEELIGPASSDSFFKNVGHAFNNTFRTVNYDTALDLLEKETLDFDLGDSARAVMEEGSRAEGWREELLRRGASREYKKTLYEVLLAMAEKRDAAAELLGEINRKNEEITQFLDKVEGEATTVRDNSTELQKKGQADKLFVAPDVTNNLMPLVLAPSEQNGLIARGREIKNRDPVTAWDDYGVPAQRMSQDGQKIVNLGHHSRDGLVTNLNQSHAELSKDEVKTEWAFSDQAGLSTRLNDAANKAMRVPVGEDLKSLKTDVDQLEKRVLKVVSQNRERTKVSPGLISAAEERVEKAREAIDQQLKSMGAFADGTPDQVMREPELDPTTRTQAAHQHLAQVKPNLDQGKTGPAQEHLDALRSLSSEAHNLVGQTEKALEAYPSTLAERKSRTESIDQSVENKYEPSFARIAQLYEPVVQRLVAKEVNSGDTIADDVEKAEQSLATARRQTQAAERNFDRAYLLNARDDLSRTDGTLVGAQNQLDSITNAESLLAQKQQGAESELKSLGGRLRQTESRAGAVYVRGNAKRSLGQAREAVEQANEAVHQTPKNPYTAKDALSTAESARRSTESAIDSDKQAYDSANAAISKAGSDISSAESTIHWADRQSWHFSNSEGSCSESVSRSDLSSALSSLSSAQSTLNQARGQMPGQDYEEAASIAGRASSYADDADSEARSAVRRAESRFESEKRDLERREYERIERERREREERERREREAREARERAEREARERREREERERRERERRDRDNGSGGGSWGGGGGGGGNGSGGGGW